MEGVWEQDAEVIFGPKRDDMTGGWRQLYIECHTHALFISIISVI
jgi:hypothetical protein